MVEVGREYRRGERDSDCAADLLRGVDEAGGKAGFVRLDPRERRDRHGNERERDPDADEEIARQQIRRVAPIHRDLRVPQHSADQ